eukprot:TRINITY_DN3590_c0_g1_i1.p2 TRINITY_DN3590_c0_g1~~TRINITY_DN3590_c0_g1_i1.p2  ORF type:complete len:182 (-),score=39.63 TRINITY_DN3590_c0_g1_i1:124-669(-)
MKLFTSQSDGKKITMQQFKQFLQIANLLSNDFKEREASLAFALSKDAASTGSGDKQTLSFYEFVEALARIAEKLAFGPIGITEEEKKLWPLMKRITLPLQIKLEGLIKYLLQQKIITNPGTSIPKESMFKKQIKELTVEMDDENEQCAFESNFVTPQKTILKKTMQKTNLAMILNSLQKST